MLMVRAKLVKACQAQVSLSRFTAVLAVLFALSLSGCGGGAAVQEDINEAFYVGVPTPTATPTTPPVAGCFIDRHTQPAAEVTRKLDLLFVVDTSGSLDEERGAIADGIESFISALPPEVDYRIAVMLGHGKTAAQYGKLYSYQNNATYRVLDPSMGIATIKTRLRNNLMLTLNDNDTDGGEAGLASLRRSLDDDRLALARSQGFYRTDAALAVVFVADEQDICADYPAGVTPVLDTNYIEPGAKIANCTRTAPARIVDGVVITPSYTEVITPESVLRALRDVQGERPLVVGGITYNSNVYPRTGENEYAYGYNETIAMANGVSVDLASGNYSSGLNQIGALATVRMSLNSEFSLMHQNVDPATIDVQIDGSVVPFQYIAEFNQIGLTGALGTALSTVDIRYCENAPVPSPSPSASPDPSPSPSPSPTPSFGVDPMCLVGSYAPKASLVTGISIDPAEGSMATIMSGLSAIGINPIVYTDAEIAANKPILDGVTALIISRKVVITAIDSAYVTGIRAYIASGGGILAEYDGAALLFNMFSGLNVAFEGHFNPMVGLFNGNVSGGGLLLPISFSSATVIDGSHPIMSGVPGTINTGLRTAFAISGYDTAWFNTLATYTSNGGSGSIPAGTFPAVMATHCGPTRIAVFTMNHLQALSAQSSLQTMTTNAFNWLVGP